MEVRSIDFLIWLSQANFKVCLYELYLVLVRAQAPVVRGPYWNCSDSPSPHFWGPKHAQTHETLHTRQKWWKFTIYMWVSEVGVAKWLDSGTYKISTKCPLSYVSHTCTNLVDTCSTPIPPNKSLGTKSKTQQEVCYFEFSQQVLCRFCTFQVFYLNELRLEIYRHQIWSV